MLPVKRKSPDTASNQPEEASPKKHNTNHNHSHNHAHALGFNARAPWLHDSGPQRQREWRTLGNRAVQPSLPLSNMVSAVQDLIDPEFDPLIAILDDEPRFLRPLPARMEAEDLEFLRIRGALSIPETGLRNELLRCYIKWVHGLMPVLDLQGFLGGVARNEFVDGHGISLLLFQAVMFVATAFVEFRFLRDAGFADRKSARATFYTRVRLLYSLDCEEDRIAIIQTLLLMTYYSDHANHPRHDIWDWIGVCNTQAQSIGLNRDASSAAEMDIRMKKLRTRLWWCLYSRDRLIAMGLRRPSQLNEGTSNVPMLKLEDFDFETYEPAVVEMFHCRLLEDITHQKRLAVMFIEKAKLCQCLGRVLFAQYAPSQCSFGTTTRTTITLVPRQASESELARCSQKLESWVNTLPKDAQFIPESRSSQIQEGEDVLLLHSAMLRMLYHATVSTLHRPWAALYNNKDQSKTKRELSTTARSKMHTSALAITHIVLGLNSLNLTRFLPQSGVTVILPAAVSHLTNFYANADNPSARETAIHNFRRCVNVLHGLKEIYPAADMEVANIEAAVRVQAGSVGGFMRVMQYGVEEGNDASTGQGARIEEGQEQTQSQQQQNGEQGQRKNSIKLSSPKPTPAPARQNIINDDNKRAPFYDLNDSHDPLSTDLFPFALDMDIDLNNFPLPDFASSQPPPLNAEENQNVPPTDIAYLPVNMDYWTNELFSDTELEQQFPMSDLGSGLGPAQRRDTGSFGDGGHGDPSIHLQGQGQGHEHENRQHNSGARHGNITGDLDRDLGFL